MPLLNLNNASVRHEPFTVFFLRDLLPPNYYDELADAFPPLSLFRFRTRLGNKYLLTESEGESYFNFIESSPPWARFYNEIKSNEFKEQVLGFLSSYNIGPTPSVAEPAGNLTARFEFSALPTNGGSQRPHTDSPRKLVTLVLSLMKYGEWSEDWGGGTSICKPTNPELYFNYDNEYLDFEDVEIVDSFAFVPNACVLFVKTAVSWHCVTPINLPLNSPIRKTVAISLYHADEKQLDDWSRH